MAVINTIEPHPMRASGAPVLLPSEGVTFGGGRDEALIRQWLRILVKWRWVVLGSIAMALIAGIIATFLMTRMYTATVTLEIARDHANVVNMEGVEPTIGSLDQEFYQTQYGLLESRSLAEAVARELKLHESRTFFELFGEGEATGPFSDVRDAPLPAEGSADRLRKAGDILLDHVAISPVRASRLVTIGFESPDPDLSARIADTWAKNFIESNLARRFEATSYARDFLEDRLQQVRKQLEVSERELVNYAANNDIVTLGAPSEHGSGRVQERSIVSDNLIALNEQLAVARGERIAAESRFRQGGGSGASPESLTNPAIATLRQRRAEIAAEYARMMAQFEPAYPPAQALAAQLSQLDRSIASEEARVRNSLANQYQEAVSREAQLAAQVGTLQDQVIGQRRLGIQYNIFQRDVDTNRELYNALLQRYKEIGVAGGVGTNNVAIVDAALTPTKPSQPRPLLNLLLALLAGTALGVGLAFILEQIDEAIADPADLERMLDVPALGTIPKLVEEDPLLSLDDRKSPISEAYLSAETRLRFSTPEGMPRSLLITSTRPGEGKSTSSIALALTIARLGQRVLLVDGDMRSPSVHQLLGISNAEGLSGVLSGNATLAAASVETGHQNLVVLPAGPTPPNAAELLSGVHLDELIRDALLRFDAVLIDAPPVMGLADAPLIASKAAGTIVVIEANRTRSRQAVVALRRLKDSRANVLGMILTKFDSERAHYGYGYDYGYGYGYGSQDERLDGDRA